jgi:tetratricopeptide (TPR) repeat protein
MKTQVKNYYKTRLCSVVCVVALFVLAGCAGVLPGEDSKILQNLASEYFAIAGAYANLGQYENALTYYKLAMRDKNFYTASYYESARMNALLSRWDDAKKMYETLLLQDRNNKDLRASLAYVTAMSGDLVHAESLYAELLVSNGYDEALHENYIRILAAQKKGTEAIHAFETYTELFPLGTAKEKLTELIAPFMPKDDEATYEE